MRNKDPCYRNQREAIRQGSSIIEDMSVSAKGGHVSLISSRGTGQAVSIAPLSV